MVFNLIKNRNKIKLFIMLILLFQKIVFSMQDAAARDENYRDIICYNRRRRNVINAILLFGLVASSYLIVKKCNQKILKGEDFSGCLQFLNQHKNIVFKTCLITKNIFLPGLSYALLFNMRKKDRWIYFCEKYFGKSIMQDKFMEYINHQGYEYCNPEKKNIFEGTVATWLMNHSDFLRSILDTLRYGIFISNRRFFGLGSYCWYAGNKEYYNWVRDFENCVIKYPKNLHKKNESQKKLFEIQEILETKHNKSFWINFFLLIVTNTLLGVLMYKIYLNMNNIETYGLDGNCIINFLKKINIPSAYIGEIVANTDWVYWFHQFFLYGLLPTGISLLTNIFVNNRIENNLLQRINYILIDNHNTLTKNGYRDELSRINQSISQFKKNIKDKKVKDFFDFICSDFRIKEQLK